MGRRKTSISDAQTVKASIVDKAEALFREVGYSKTTVGEIAKALGMSQANVYRYFPTKAAINEVICERVVTRIEDRCGTVTGTSRSAAQRLVGFWIEYFRAVKDNVIKDKRLHEMVARAVEQHWPVIQGHVERMDAMTRELLADGVASGEFKQMDIPSTSLALQNAFSAFTYPALVERQIADAEHRGADERIEADMRELARIMMNGIAAR